MTGTGKYEQLLQRCASLEPVATAVAHPCEASALAGAIEAGEKKLITPILVGPAAKIREVANEAGISLGSARIVDATHSHESAAKAVALVRSGEAELLMKGSLHTDELLGAVVARETGLRTGRRISHVFIMDVPTYHKVLIVTDAAINIAPALDDKVDICQNAIDLARALGRARARTDRGRASLRSIGARRRHRGRREEPDHADPCRSGRQDPRGCRCRRHQPRLGADCRVHTQPRFRIESRRASAIG